MDIYALTSQEVLERISRHCPQALSIYLQCLNRSKDDGTFLFTKNMVEVDMSEEWSAFKKNIKKLAKENLLEWHPLDGGIAVTLVDLNAHE